jgi:hypothetical protein
LAPAEPLSEEELKKQAKEFLKTQLADTSISKEEKDVLVAKAIKDEIKRLGDAKNDKKVAAYIDKV